MPHHIIAGEPVLVYGRLRPITFSGSVAPNHAGGTVLLQSEKGAGDDWRTLKRGTISANSTYQIAFAWRIPGPATSAWFLRVTPAIRAASQIR